MKKVVGYNQLQLLHPKHKCTEALTKTLIFNMPVPHSEAEDVLVDTVFLAILHLSGASFREFYENKIRDLKIIRLRRGAAFWYSHTSLMDSSTSAAASKHSEEMCTYLGFIPW